MYPRVAVVLGDFECFLANAGCTKFSAGGHGTRAAPAAVFFFRSSDALLPTWNCEVCYLCSGCLKFLFVFIILFLNIAFYSVSD